MKNIIILKINNFNFQKKLKRIIKKLLINFKCKVLINKFIIILLMIVIIKILLFRVKNYRQKQRIIKLLKGKIFINKNLKGELINKEIFYVKNQPKLSVIIPVYNAEKTINYSIRSIQNQKMKDIEIILINDYSSDNSLEIIKEIKNTDERIKLINNNKNMGALYSRCIGVLESKGIYILSLDNDDMFFDEDVFDIVYKEAKKKNYDILGFKAIDSPNYYSNIKEYQNDYFHEHKNNLILHQPDLGIFPISRNNKYFPNDFHIWGKSIKNEIYKKAINKIGVKRYSTFMSWHEDTVIVFIIFNLAKSFKFIGKYGIFHLISNITATYTQPKDNIMFGEIFFLDIIFDFTSNNKRAKEIVAQKAIELKDLQLFNISNNKNKNFLNKVLKKIINCQYISTKEKNVIRKKYAQIFF